MAQRLTPALPSASCSTGPRAAGHRLCAVVREGGATSMAWPILWPRQLGVRHGVIESQATGVRGGAEPRYLEPLAPRPGGLHCLPEPKPTHHHSSGRHRILGLTQQVPKARWLLVEGQTELVLAFGPAVLCDHVRHQRNFVLARALVEESRHFSQHFGESIPCDGWTFGG